MSEPTSSATLTREDVASPWYRKDEACTYLRISMDTLDRYIASGIVIVHKVEGRQTVRIHRDDLDAALKRIDAAQR